MIQIILKDKWNPRRSDSCVFETSSAAKAAIFIKALKSTLDYNQWEIKTIIGG
jgi:hypothetical protein